MKDFLFNLVARTTYACIWFSDRLFGLPAALLLWIAQFVRMPVARIGFGLMKLIDPTKAKAAEAEAEAIGSPEELAFQNMELKLLQSAYQVRDHAKETGDWTDHHSEAIEAIGNALLLDIGWEEEHIHAHLRAVVESIEGLEYDVFPENED